MVKNCTKCGVEFEYKKHSWCNSCRSLGVQEYMKKHRDKKRKWNAEYAKRHIKKFTEKNKIYREKYPEKHKAHNKVITALRNGSLIKLPCETCGEKAHAHHDNYNNPLNVKWLCHLHHMELHKSMIEFENKEKD